LAKVKETTFVAEVASWINIYLANNKELPFTQAKVEESPKGSRKRRDLILYDRDGKVALSGEVKMPDAPDGKSPYDERVVKDAEDKACARYFFTWNVNRFVLWDRQMFNVPRLQRRARQWELLQLKSSEDVGKPFVVHKIRDEFIPELLHTFARIYKGETDFGAHPPDKHFIFMLESFLERPVDLTLNYVYENFPSNRGFSKSFRKWMVEQGWTVLESIPESQKEELLERAAKLSCYVLANKLIFYEALRRQFPKLKRLSIPTSVDNVNLMEGELAKFFAKAQKESGDYETLFWPDFGARLPLFASGAIDAWRDVIKQIVLVDLKDIEYDVLGNIFERLIDPDERHKYGQHYTDAHIVDVINAFTIRDGNEIVMDPACGSGTFLVRAYARKRVLTEGELDHQTLLRQLYGVDISGYAVHLSSVSLATRDLVKAENYPRVFRQDFFDLRPNQTYSVVPGKKEAKAHSLSDQPSLEFTIPSIDAGVGNPPYIRQETIKRKEYYQNVVKREAPGFNLSGRSDIYIYFWPHLLSFLKDGGTLGLLTSSSWLDVEYGFRLQKWFLNNFKIVAVLESVCEPWFTQARVATAVTILKRCKDESERMDNKVRFVQLKVPLDEILENDGTEKGRLEAANDFRDKIEGITKDTSTDQYRIICKTQMELWEEGLEPEEENPRTERKYRGGKWGVYLRAPDFFFEIMEKYGASFVLLESVAEIKFGTKSGCDAFFYPRDISEEALKTHPNQKEFKEYYGVTRNRVQKGTVKIVRAGDGSVWPIEAKFLEPEIDSLMELDSITIEEEKLVYQILLVGEPKEKLKGELVKKYIEYGEEATFGDKEGRPVSDRPTCASRKLWYDLTNATRSPIVYPKLFQYKHIIPYNSNRRSVNCSLLGGEARDDFDKTLSAILNSTWLAIIKNFYARQLGREGNIQIDVYAAKMIPIPNPTLCSEDLAERLKQALDSLASRKIGQLVEETFMQTKRYRTAEKMKDDPIQLPQELRQKDRQELDDAVLELIGVSDPKERVKLRKRLYEEVTKFYRQVRLLELQAIENKNRSKRKTGITAQKIADDIWDELPKDTIKNYPDNFLKPDEETDSYVLPDGKAKFLYAADMINKPTLKFPERKIEFRHKTQAELVLALHDAGYSGSLSLPIKETRCKEVLQKWNEYLDNLRETFEDMGYERSGDEERVISAVDILMKRAVNG
jgi:type I restriction-modification system DNA methylase subunit